MNDFSKHPLEISKTNGDITLLKQFSDTGNQEIRFHDPKIRVHEPKTGKIDLSKIDSLNELKEILQFLFDELNIRINTEKCPDSLKKYLK